MTKDTYYRFKEALEAIAAGEGDAAKAAAEALRSRKRELGSGKPQPVRRSARDIADASHKRAERIYQQWVAAGKPSKKKFAVSLGMNPHTGATWIKRAEWVRRWS